MECENCHENEATVHYTEIINGVKNEHHLCGECAAKSGLSGYMSVPSSEFPFVKLLTGLLASSGLIGGEVDNPMLHVKCPQCGMNFQEFTQVGKFGCAECYDVFGPLIEDNMKKLQGSVEHNGKKYRLPETKGHDAQTEGKQTERSGTDDLLDRIALLNAKLQEAVALENYEEAAKYRDEMKALKERNDKNA